MQLTTKKSTVHHRCQIHDSFIMIKSTSKIRQILPPDLLVTAVVVGQTMNIPYNPMMNIPWPMLSYTKSPTYKYVGNVIPNKYTLKIPKQPFRSLSSSSSSSTYHFFSTTPINLNWHRLGIFNRAWSSRKATYSRHSRQWWSRTTIGRGARLRPWEVTPFG